MLDSLDTFLITLKVPIHLNGIAYFSVWGRTYVENYEGIPLVIVGGCGNELGVAVDNIQFAMPWPDTPTDAGVLIRGCEYDEIFADAEEIEPPALVKIAS